MTPPCLKDETGFDTEGTAGASCIRTPTIPPGDFDEPLEEVVTPTRMRRPRVPRVPNRTVALGALPHNLIR